MSRFVLSAIALTWLLTGCETVPKEPPPLPPRLVVPPLVLEYPERNWQEEMQLFLRGTVPTPLDYKLPSKPVKPGTSP